MAAREVEAQGVFQGDCLTLLPTVPDRSVDLVLCDLPYGNFTQNRWDNPIDLDALWIEYRRILKPRGVVALTAAGVFVGRLMLSAPDLYRYKIVWRKNKPRGFLNAKKQPLRVHEDVLIFYDESPRFFPQKTTGHAPTHGFTKRTSDGSNYGRTRRGVSNPGGRTDRYPVDVIEIPVVNNDDPLKVAPTQKPVALGEWFVRSYTQPGDLVLDNACGSGAFLVAAKRLGRRFWGCDRDKKIVRHAQEWLDRTRPQESK